MHSANNEPQSRHSCHAQTHGVNQATST